MKSKIVRLLVATGLAVFVVFFTVKCPNPTTNFTTARQPLPATITVTVGGVQTVFGLDTTTISGSTSNSNISGTTMAAKSSCQVTSMSFSGKVGVQSFNPPVAGIVGDQPIQVDIVTPEEDKTKP